MADQILRYPELLENSFLHPEDFVKIAKLNNISRNKAIEEVAYDKSSFAQWQYRNKKCSRSAMRSFYHCAIAKGWLKIDN